MDTSTPLTNTYTDLNHLVNAQEHGSNPSLQPGRVWATAPEVPVDHSRSLQPVREAQLAPTDARTREALAELETIKERQRAQAARMRAAKKKPAPLPSPPGDAMAVDPPGGTYGLAPTAPRECDIHCPHADNPPLDPPRRDDGDRMPSPPPRRSDPVVVEMSEEPKRADAWGRGLCVASLGVGLGLGVAAAFAYQQRATFVKAWDHLWDVRDAQGNYVPDVNGMEPERPVPVRENLPAFMFR